MRDRKNKIKVIISISVIVLMIAVIIVAAVLNKKDNTDSPELPSDNTTAEDNGSNKPENEEDKNNPTIPDIVPDDGNHVGSTVIPGEIVVDVTKVNTETKRDNEPKIEGEPVISDGYKEVQNEENN